ncbi:hypothetical protein MVES_001917 [Malassezia vespertilionis]|uniref:Integral membrane bound transporter domain-containing protein n=2 Tax=Malassezia vespertilionis TaxID=2020962 RepID=A0A2N1JC02_9BASI|nr:hypothetical protein MVES_001917 [Malassezia vespertilionis]
MSDMDGADAEATRAGETDHTFPPVAPMPLSWSELAYEALLSAHGPYTFLNGQVTEAFALLRVVNSICYGVKPKPTTSVAEALALSLSKQPDEQSPCAIIEHHQEQMRNSVATCTKALHTVLKERQYPNVDKHDTRRYETAIFRSEMYGLSLFAVSLTQLANHTASMLDEAKVSIKYYEEHSFARPHLSYIDFWSWLRTTSGIGLFGITNMDDAFVSDNEKVDSPAEKDGAGSENDPDALLSKLFSDLGGNNSAYKIYAANVARASRRDGVHSGDLGIRQRWQHFYQSFLRLEFIVDLRIRTSFAIRAVRRSRHLRYGLKLASGVLLLCMPLLLDPARKDWWITSNGQWMVISFIWCMESSTGDSFRISIARLLGTVCGTIAGLVVYEISRGNPYALAVLLIALEIPISLIRQRTHYKPFGAVMGLTVAVVTMVPYLGNMKDSAGMVAVIRGYMICIGVVSALIVSTAVWPYHAHVNLGKKIANTTTMLQTLYLGLTRHLFYVGFRNSEKSRSRFTNFERRIAANLDQSKALCVIMNNEMSLVPKPIAVLKRALLRLNNVFCLFVGLRKLRELGTNEIYLNAVTDMVDLRQELASSIILTLWIIGQSLKSHARLPQFLPSMQRALEDLTEAFARIHGDRAYVRTDHAHGLDCWRGVFDAPHYQGHDSILHLWPTPPSASTPVNAVKKAAEHKKGKGAESNAFSTDALLYVLAEHMLLAQVVADIEALLYLTRTLLGELSILNGNAPFAEDTW